MKEIQNSELTLSQKALEKLRLRLLDLTSRNRLINFRHTKKGNLRIIDEQPNQLVENLLSDIEMRFLPVPEPTENELIDKGYLKLENKTKQLIRLRKDPPADEWAKQLGLDTRYEVPEPSNTNLERHKDSAIQTLLYPYEMEARLKDLMQMSESAIQEMGANILYLALGFLEWYENNSHENSRIAPLFLVPVRLRKGRLNIVTRTYEYTLGYSGEDIIPNLSLREKMKVDFSMALPELDENTIPEDYFSQVQNLIADAKPRWRVRRYISLALLNFSKLLMYLDLDPARWPEKNNIIDHPVVKSFLEGYEKQGNNHKDGNTQRIGFGEEYLIDETEGIHTHYPLIDNADSSQHSALIDAVNGKNLVIEGPPGTGKSQTITNLIAAAMSQRKRVLFVAEKLAALEVVRRRLDSLMLGEFCLELHSHKSQKNRVLNEISERLKKHGHYRKPKDINVDISRYEELKDLLRKHVEKINGIWKNTGKTLHEIFMAASRYRNVIEINPELIHPKGYNGENYNAVIQRRNKDLVNTYVNVYQAVAAQLEGHSDLREHPWCGVRNGDLQLFDLDSVIDSLEGWQQALLATNNVRSKIANVIICDVADVPSTLYGLYDLLREMEEIPTLKGGEILMRLPILRGDVLIKAQRYHELFIDIQESYESLATRIGIEPLQDLKAVERFIKVSEQLKKLIDPQIILKSLANAINRLELIHDLLEDLREPLDGVLASMGEPATKHLSLSESGICEFKSIIDLVSILKPSYWSHRNELFDNEELDNLLPQLRSDFIELQELAESIQHVFKIESLPSEHEIRELKTILINGSIFKWLNGSWRSARKQVLSYSIHPKPKLPKVLSLLDNLADFSGKRQKFENNKHYKNALGEYLIGLDTDVDALESLRGWYKLVRRQYGYGFGQKVALGNAILSMQQDIAKALRSLSEQGIQARIVSLADDMKSLRRIFSPVVGIHSFQTLLGGKDGIISQLIKNVNQAVETCSPLVIDKTLTIGDLISHIGEIDVLKQKIDKWHKADFDKKLFNGKLGLNPGISIDNEKGLAILRNTLNLASYIDKKLSYSKLSEYIFSNPFNSTFESLISLSNDIRFVLESQNKTYEYFSKKVLLNKEDWITQTDDRIEELISRNSFALAHPDTLQNWLDYIRVRNQFDNVGLDRFADQIEKNRLAIESAETAYQAGIFDLLSREILRENPELGRFSGRTQESYQQQFRNYDIKLMQLQCEQIAWAIDQTTIPHGVMGGRVSDLTEKALIDRECIKKTRHIPLRQLLHRAGNAIAAIKPCFMMGPMSVAQYLAPGQITFDMVIMDEASQIKPQDALGAVARGGQLVVVGDPKQLPPTNFFERAVDDDGFDDNDTTTIEESESILDATLPMFPARRLRWHYRSQHESLIAFSNHMFYDNDLVLFPSPHKQTANFGIQFSRVPRGCFVNRRNMEEAKIISEAVREHLKHHPDESLGVVAMSSEQRLQIERAIEVLAKEDSFFQEWLEKDANKLEPLFIKNLENVQGDERDVIYISMTYGPQEPGSTVPQRFGPINMDMGWRRLNVLFTRSKKRMHVFSSMGSNDIIIGASSKRGVKALRDFLTYCETGILHRTEKYSGRDPDSDFEIAVMNALCKEGFECVPQVGVAGFFIDVAVVDPGNPGRYLMGIECDGATYHSAKSVRDRDRLRQTILERLGWEIRRVWSTDWFKNPHGELLPIIRKLHELKSVFTPDDEIIHDVIETVNEVDDVLNVGSSDFFFEKGSLRDKLIRFDREVIRKEFPNTSDNNRLLRPAMLEALIEFTPTSKGEFLETVPSYMRQATKAEEGKYLEQVFEIINTSMETLE